LAGSEPQWHALPLPEVAPFSRITLAADAASPWLYAAFASISDPFVLKAVYRIEPGSPQWEQVFSNPPLSPSSDFNLSVYNAALAVDPVESDSVYVGAENLYRFTRIRGSRNWQGFPLGDAIHFDHHALAFDPRARHRFYVANDGGVFRSSDRGVNFTSLNDGLCIAEIQAFSESPDDEDVFLLGTRDNGAQIMHRSHESTSVLYGDVGGVLINPYSTSKFMAARGDSVYRSADGGCCWEACNTHSVDASTYSILYPPLAFDYGAKIVAYGKSPFIFFDLAAGDGDFSVALQCCRSDEAIVSLTFASDDVLFAGTSKGGVYRIRRSPAEGWKSARVDALHCAPLPQGHWVRGLASASAAGDELLIVLTGYGNRHLWRATIDAGGRAVWTSLDGKPPHALPNAPANSLTIDPADPRRIFVGTDIGVYQTRDGAATWSNFSRDLPKTRVNALSLNPKTRRMRAGTEGRGLWETFVPVTPGP